MPEAKSYFTGGAVDPSQPLSISGVSVQERMPPMYVNRPNGFPFYLFIHFHDPVEILVGKRTALYPPHTLMLWPPGTAHYYGTGSRHWVHTWMNGLGKKIAPLLASSGLPLETPLQLPNAKITDQAFQALFEEVRRFARPDEIILESLFTVWLRRIARQLQTVGVSTAIPARLLAVRERLERNPAQPHTLAALAHIASLSVSQFSATFKQHFGTSPINYLLELRLRRAMYHLSDHNLNITEVGRKVGFEDPFYFSKQFKKHFGLSPQNYRRQMSAQESPQPQAKHPRQPR